MRSVVAALWVGCALAVLSVGCSPPEAQLDPNATVDPSNCAGIITFGNGQTCDVKSTQISECGVAEDRVCANGWLCFDAAQYAFCSCHVDTDCQPRADYVNKARAVRKVAPLGAKCVQGRCAGAP